MIIPNKNCLYEFGTLNAAEFDRVDSYIAMKSQLDSHLKNVLCVLGIAVVIVIIIFVPSGSWVWFLLLLIGGAPNLYYFIVWARMLSGKYLIDYLVTTGRCRITPVP